MLYLIIVAINRICINYGKHVIGVVHGVQILSIHILFKLIREHGANFNTW